MDSVAANERRTVHYQGHVQGVGFRYTVLRIAAGFAVAGYVKNLPDGRVRLIAEGTAGELDGFLETIRAEMAQYIRNLHLDSTPATGEFDDFAVRH
jgi:acylphosphatase